MGELRTCGGGVMSVLLAVGLLLACGREERGPRGSGGGDGGSDQDAGPPPPAIDAGPMPAPDPDGGPPTGIDAGPAPSPDGGPRPGTDAGPPPRDPEATLVRRYGTFEDDVLVSVVVDAAGNVYASGSVGTGDAYLDTTTLGPAMRRNDHLVLSITSAGALRWARRLAGAPYLNTGLAPSSSLALGPDGALWMGGVWEGSADFGDGVTRTASWQRGFVLTLDPGTGTTRTVRTFGHDLALCQIHDVYPLADGSFVIGGAFAGRLDLGGGPLVPGVIGDGGDGFVATFEASGAHRWSFGFTESIVGRTAVDAAGNVYVCGGARDSTDIGDGRHDVSGDDYVPFVTSFDASGRHRWAHVWPASPRSSAYAMAAQPDGTNAIIVLGGIRFGGRDYGGAVHAVHSSTGAEMFARGLLASWAFTRPGPAGSWLVTGFSEGPADLGGGARLHHGGFDVIVASYDATGAHRWSNLLGSAAHEIGMSVAPDGAGGAWLAGWVAGPESRFAPMGYAMNDALLARVQP